MALGDAYIRVHADFDPFEREVKQQAARAAGQADDIFEKTGKQWGASLSESTTEELGKHGDDFAEAVSRSTRGHIIKTEWGFRNTKNGRFAEGLDDEIEGQIGKAFDRLDRPGGPLSKFGEAIQDAVGAGFNVSGRSPLIALLIPAIGAIGALIGAAIQAVNALIAVLVTVPALIASIALQVGVVALAFDGVGKAVQGAFAAKNAFELNEAIKGLTPSAQAFVRSLLPLRDLFNNIKAIAQENFFRGLGDVLGRIARVLGPIFRGAGFAKLAFAMGDLFAKLGNFFTGQNFQHFINDVIPATLRWIAKFGPAFVTFVSALVRMADAAMPFLERIGSIVTNAFNTFSKFINEQTNNGNLSEWLNSMGDTLDSVVELFFQVSKAVAGFLSSLDKAGGKELIDALADAFEHFGNIIASPLGQKALEGLIDTLIFLTQAFFGLVDMLLILAAAGETAGEAIHAFFDWLFGPAKNAAADFFTQDFPAWIGGLVTSIGNFFSDLWFKIRFVFAGIVATVQEKFFAVINFIAGLPTMIVNAIGDLGSLLFSKGKALVQGFIDGIKSKWNELRNAAASIAHAIGDWLPGSPAKEGPLAGRGYTMLRGQRMVQDLIKGIQSQDPALRDASLSTVSQVVNFGGIKMNFTGPPPTAEQARSTGRALGVGIEAQMTRRDVALAVRTI